MSTEMRAPGALVSARGRDWLVLPRDEADVIRLRPDVVVLDRMLRGMDGTDLTRDILAVYDVPVTLLSAYDQDEVIAKAFDLGAVDAARTASCPSPGTAPASPGSMPIASAVPLPPGERPRRARF